MTNWNLATAIVSYWNKSMQPHTITSYDADLKALEDMINEMASRAGHAVDDSSKALFERNPRLAQQVITADQAIDLLQHRIEEKAIQTIARRQPVAIDLRQIVSTMRIANDLERIGDLAKNVAKRVIAIGEQPTTSKVVFSLSNLSARVQEQLGLIFTAYRKRDDAAALQVWRSDGAIDALHTSLFRELLTYMMEDPRNIGFCAHLLFCAKNFERMGDHATNIAETVHYMITGELLSAERPKADASSATSPNMEPERT